METDFELSRLAAEGRDFSREEEDPFGHAEAVLQRKGEEQAMRVQR